MKNTDIIRNGDNIKFIKTWELSEKDKKHIKGLLEKGYIEFRDGWGDDRSGEYHSDIFLAMEEWGVVKTDDMDWHLTYYLTESGKKLAMSL